MRLVVDGLDSETPTRIMSKEISARPFLKWAGSKKQLLGAIKGCLPVAFYNGCYKTFVDGFLGGGAVTFMAMNEFADECGGRVQSIVANDANADLIGCFRAVKNQVEPLISALEKLQADFHSSKDGGAYYNHVRDLFNDRARCSSQLDRAACFIFLNHAGFNGLYRVNADGDFNVPYGHRQSAIIFSPELLRVDSALFRRCNVDFCVGDFEIDDSHYGGRADETLFYFDPPYRPVSHTASFRNYTKDSFGEQEQVRLARHCVALCEKGAGVIASNSDTPDNFYERYYTGFEIRRVETKRMVNANVKKRGKVSEVLLSRF